MKCPYCHREVVPTEKQVCPVCHASLTNTTKAEKPKKTTKKGK